MNLTFFIELEEQAVKETAYTFFTQKNMKSAGELIQILTEANQVRFYSLS
jgi:hypothetical protein